MRLCEADIVLVEDSQEDVDLILHTLRRENLANNILVVRDGEEALDFLFRRRDYAGCPKRCLPKLVVLDLKLPKVDGLEVLKQLKADPQTKSVPVVVLTSSTEERDVVRSYDLGANSYIQKAVDFDYLRETIKTLGTYWLVINHGPVANGAARRRS